MLPDLLYRNWLLNRRALLFKTGIFAAFQFFLVHQAVSQQALWLGANSFIAAAISIAPLAMEDGYRAHAWSCTLPVTRANLVKGHYVSAWVLAAGMLLVAIVVTAVVPGGRIRPFFAFWPGSLLLAGTFITAVLAFLMPALFRFGLLGILALLIPVNIVLPTVFVISKVTGTQDDVEGTVIAGIRAITELATAWRDGLSRPLFYLAVLLTLLFVNWASYRVAVVLFLRREL